MGEQLEIRALGGLAIERGGMPVTGFESKKVAALLMYLALTGRPHAREVLGELFWPFRPRARVLNRLGVVLSNLRKTIDPALFLDEPRDPVTLNPAFPIWIDVAAFDACLDESSDAPRMVSLEQAVNLYQGEFLAGVYIDSDDFEEWARFERERLRMRVLDVLDKLVTLHSERGEYVAGIERANQILQIDKLKEEAHRQIMLLLARSGQRAAALAQYETCCRALEQELDIEPTADTVRLYEQIRDGEIRFEDARPRINVAVADVTLVTSVDDLPARSRPPSRLVGRSDLLDTLAPLLACGERVLLQGFAGAGKSALAATVAAAFLDVGRGPVIWIQAGNETPETIFWSLARSLGARWHMSQQPDAQARAISALLAEHGIRLVVLDDAWDGESVECMMAAVPLDVPLLITSRHRFPVITLIHVPVLRRPASIDLLSHHAGSDLAEDPDAAALCAALGDLPFAVRIAGEMLALDALLPRELLNELGETPHALQMPEGFEAERQDVATLLETSLDALDESTRTTFMAFGALSVPDATSELLALVMGHDETMIRQTLRELRRRGLAERQQLHASPFARYGVHDLAYTYARANHHLDRRTVMEACRVYAERYSRAIDALDLEIGNLLGAAQQARQTSDDALLVDIMYLLAVEAAYFEGRGYGQQVLDLLEAAANAAKSTDRLEAAHFLWCRYGNGCSILGNDLERGLDAYMHSLELARLLNNANREATLLTLIGTTRFRLGAEDADQYYEQAYQLATTGNDDSALSFILAHRSFFEGSRHPPNYHNSRRFADEAAQLAARLGKYDDHLAALSNRGNCERALGQAELALQTHRKVFEIASAQNNRRWMASALCSLGEDYHALGNREQARHCLAESLDLYEQLGNTNDVDVVITFMRENDYRE